MKKGGRIVVGVDEVGRGPVAGPVTVCAVSCPARAVAKLVARAEAFAGCRLRDSKKLSPTRRAAFAKFVRAAARAGECSVRVASRSAATIDAKGIVSCLRACAAACVRAVAPDVQDADVRLDAGLKAPAEYVQRSIVRGDESEPLIALASIVAKETRDAYMRRIARTHPAYGFERHVGYGTRDHYTAMNSHGMCMEHRRSFLKARFFKC